MSGGCSALTVRGVSQGAICYYCAARRDHNLRLEFLHFIKIIMPLDCPQIQRLPTCLRRASDCLTFATLKDGRTSVLSIGCVDRRTFVPVRSPPLCFISARCNPDFRRRLRNRTVGCLLDIRTPMFVTMPAVGIASVLLVGRIVVIAPLVITVFIRSIHIPLV